MSNLIISRESLEQDFYKKLDGSGSIYVSPDNAVNIVDAKFGISGIKDPGVKLLDNTRLLGAHKPISLSGKFRNGFDVPLGDLQQSINDRARAVRFAGASTNTLDESWTDLFDAMRLDLTIKAMGQSTIRQLIYSLQPMPDATPTIKPQELFPYAFEFSAVDGQGQAIPQGVKMGGRYDSIDFTIYATGFTYSLLLSLFDRTFDIQRMNDGVAKAYALKRDDLAMAPILDYGYAGTQQTAASTEAGAKGQELLYLTLRNAIDDLGKRQEPSKEKADAFIQANDLILLCSSWDANHIAPMIRRGLPSVNELVYEPLSAITQIITYGTRTIEFPDKTLTFTGIAPTDKKAYLIKKNNLMTIPVKRGLTMELDAQPNVNTLAKEQRAWYFCESIFNLGIASYIQEITLPTWS